MTDYEILYEVLTDCFWAGTGQGCWGAPDISERLTVDSKLFELLDRLGLDIEDGNLIGREEE